MLRNVCTVVSIVGVIPGAGELELCLCDAINNSYVFQATNANNYEMGDTLFHHLHVVPALYSSELNSIQMNMNE